MVVVTVAAIEEAVLVRGFGFLCVLAKGMGIAPSTNKEAANKGDEAANRGLNKQNQPSRTIWVQKRNAIQ